jgi:hypothetical protein
MFLIGLIGCKTPKGPPEDPMFFSHAPIEVKAHAGPPAAVALAAEPTPPDDPMVVRKNTPEY